MASTLRITHRPGSGDSHAVTVELTGDNPARLAFSATFDFAVAEEERDRIEEVGEIERASLVVGADPVVHGLAQQLDLEKTKIEQVPHLVDDQR